MLIKLTITLTILFMGLMKYSHSRSIFSLDTIFHIYWGGICFLSILQLFNIYEVNEIIYFIVLVGNFGYFVGTIIPSLVLKRNNNQTSRLMLMHEYVQYDSIKIGLIVSAVIIIIHKIILMLPTILLVGVQGARGLMQLDDSLNLQGFEGILYTYFGRPFIRAFSIVSLVDLFKGNFSKRKILMVILFNLLVYFSDGGRSTIIMLFWALIYLLKKSQIQISRKLKKRIIITISIIIIIAVLATLERGTPVFRGLYEYYVASLVYLDKELENKNIFGEMLYGANSFQGILSPIFGILNYVGIAAPQFLIDAKQFIYEVQGSVIFISPDKNMNYFITCFGYFYRDFRWYGIFIISLITGYIASNVEAKARIYSNIRYISIAVLFMQGLMFTMSSYLFSNYNFVMSIVYIYVLTSNLFNKRMGTLHQDKADLH